MSLKRAALVCAVMAVALPSTANAAPPPNDAPAGAMVIALPFQEPVTLDEATTDPFEATLNEQCGAPAGLPTSIWLRFDATRDTGLIVDLGEFYSVVTRGDPNARDIIGCAFSSFSFPVTAGETYFIMLSSQATAGTRFLQIVQRYEIDLTVDRVGMSDRRTGAVVISGTAASTYAQEPVELDVSVSQKRRRSTISGAAHIAVECGAVPVRWTITVIPSTGSFRQGKAFAITRAAGGSRFGSDEVVNEAAVWLHRTGPWRDHRGAHANTSGAPSPSAWSAPRG